MVLILGSLDVNLVSTAVSSIINYFHTVSIGMVLVCIPALHLRVPVRVRTIVGILLNHILLVINVVFLVDF